VIAATRRLSEILSAAGVTSAEPIGGDPRISGVRLDSRRVLPGDLFCAVRGERVDGAAFVPQAIADGAVAILAASARPAGIDARVAWVRVDAPREAVGPLAREIFGRPDLAMMLVGITGTNGKTTVAWMVESIARAAGRRAARIGTIDAAWNDVVRPAERTTPEAPDLYALLAEMRDAGTEIVAMEVSSHALALGRVGGMRFGVAAFLNLGRDHLDFHGDLSGYFEAKATLFDHLAPDAVAVLPDDDLGRALRARTQATVRTFGRTDAADVRISEESVGVAGSRATLRTPEGAVRIRTALTGRFQLDNAAAAAACALAAGLSPDAVERGIDALVRVPGRTERIDRGQPFSAWVDYAHTEQALAGVLGAAREVASGRVVVVFGCGGDRDRGKRAPMGAAAARGADIVVLTSDNPRSEDPRAILREIETGARAVARADVEVIVEPDRRVAIRTALARAGRGDVVVVAGKGHETGQTGTAGTVPFDDRDEVAAALAILGFVGERRADA